jgi:predicted DNA-binding transcriptional regulator YafY
MRATRLLRLLHLLAGRGRMSAAELGRQLGVSPRTIYRDIDTLSSAGFPVYAEQGPTGGYELLADFRSPFVVLTPDEIAMLVRFGPPASAATLGLAGDLQHAYDKLRAALAAAASGRGRQVVLVDAPRWFSRTTDTTALAPLRTAATEAIRIRTTTGGRSVVLDPLGLVDKAGVWYLVARHEDGEVAAHRVDRLGPVEVTGEAFEPPAGFGLAAFWATWTATFEGSRPSVEVTIEVPTHAVDELPKALGDHVAAILAAAEPDRDGNLTVQLTFFSPEAAVHHLTGAGHLARVVAPEHIRRAVVARARQVLAAEGAAGALR